MDLTFGPWVEFEGYFAQAGSLAKAREIVP
jgi:hypothetical protein